MRRTFGFVFSRFESKPQKSRVGAGKGELSAAIGGLRFIPGVLMPPLIGRMYAWFTQPGGPPSLGPVRGVGPTGCYAVASLCLLSAGLLLRQSSRPRVARTEVL